MNETMTNREKQIMAREHASRYWHRAITLAGSGVDATPEVLMELDHLIDMHNAWNRVWARYTPKKRVHRR